MALPALRARLGLGLVRSYTTGIARAARAGNGSFNYYGKTTTAAARPIDGTRALVGYSVFLVNVVGCVCAASYLAEMRRKVDRIQSNVDLLVKDLSRRNSTEL